MNDFAITNPKQDIDDFRRKNLCLVTEDSKEISMHQVQKQAALQNIKFDVNRSLVTAEIFNNFFEYTANMADKHNMPVRAAVTRYMTISVSFVDNLIKEYECYGSEGFKGVMHAIGRTTLATTENALGARVGALLASFFCTPLSATCPIAFPICALSFTFAGGLAGSALNDTYIKNENLYDFIVNTVLDMKKTLLAKDNKQISDFITRYRHNISSYHEAFGDSLDRENILKLDILEPLQALDLIAKGEYKVRKAIMDNTPSSHPYHAPKNGLYHPNDWSHSDSSRKWQNYVIDQEIKAEAQARAEAEAQATLDGINLENGCYGSISSDGNGYSNRAGNNSNFSSNRSYSNQIASVSVCTRNPRTGNFDNCSTSYGTRNPRTGMFSPSISRNSGGSGGPSSSGRSSSNSRAANCGSNSTSSGRCSVGNGPSSGMGGGSRSTSNSGGNRSSSCNSRSSSGCSVGRSRL